MKKIALALVLAATLAGCGKPKTIDGKDYPTCGLIDKLDGDCDPGIKYKVSIGNVIWGAVLIETVVAPVYFFGFSMFNPDHKI